jgi:hypothetical protein
MSTTLIDTDAVSYTVAMPRKWRVLAETRAGIRQQRGLVNASDYPEMHALELAPHVLHLSEGFANDIIGEAVTLSCIKDVWGYRIEGASRNFLIEYARNAFQHGAALAVTVEFKEKADRRQL